MSGCPDELDDIVARYRGTWYAADPYAATGEALWPGHTDDEPTLEQQLEDYLEHLGVPAQQWQLAGVGALLRARQAGLVEHMSARRARIAPALTQAFEAALALTRGELVFEDIDDERTTP